MTPAKTLRKRIKGRDLVLDVSTEGEAYSWNLKQGSSGRSLSTGMAESEETAKAGAEAAATRYMGGPDLLEHGWYSVIQ
jgi:hypothetical protein